MVYNPGQQGIDDVRENAGNILDEYPDTSITKKIAAAYSKIQIAVKRSKLNPFVSTDTEFEHAQQLELTLATMYSLKAWGPEFIDKIKELREEANEDLELLTGGTELPEDMETDEMQVLGKSGWYANPDVPAPNRLKPYATTTQIEGVRRIDPDINL